MNKIKKIYECISSCEKDNIYKYEFKDKCYSECPSHTTERKNNDFSLNKIYFCKPVCNENTPFEIIDAQECVESCDYKEIEIKSCILNYNNFTTGDNKIVNMYDNLLKNVEDQFTSENYDTTNFERGSNDIIELDKIKITLTTTKNQKDEEKNINETTIDLNDCENKLKELYHIPDDEILFIKKIDILQEGMKIPKIEYEVYTKYNRTNLLKLNLSYCDTTKIDISIPIQLTGNLDKYNSSSKYYNDICYTSTSDSGTDITLEDRKKEFINNNKTVCQENCIFSEYNYTTQKAKCSCDIVEFPSSFSKMKIDKSEIIKNFIDIKNIVNINILVCYKVLFTLKGIRNNYGSYYLLVIIVLHFIIIILYYSKNLFRRIQYKVRDIAFGIKNIQLLQIENIHNGKSTKINKKMDKIKEKKKKPKKIKKALKIRNDEKLFSKFTSKEKNLIDKSLSRKEESILNNNNFISYLNLNIKGKKKDFKKDNNIVNDRLVTISNFSELLNKIGKIMKYNDEELNGLNYESALQMDKRNYCEYYYSLLITKHDIFFTFCNNTDYNSKIIKLDLLIFNFSFEFTINTLFFNDDTMHKIYKDKGKYNIIYQISQSLYSSIISMIFNYILRMLALSQDEIIDFKNIQSYNYVNKRMFRLIKIIKIKLILYFIFSSIFLLFFFYYISMFCAIYSNTQIHLIKDTLISFLFSLSIPIIINLLPGLFRIPSLSNIKSNRKILYLISKVLQMI